MESGLAEGGGGVGTVLFRRRKEASTFGDRNGRLMMGAIMRDPADKAMAPDCVDV